MKSGPVVHISMQGQRGEEAVFEPRPMEEPASKGCIVKKLHHQQHHHRKEKILYSNFANLNSFITRQPSIPYNSTMLPCLILPHRTYLALKLANASGLCRPL